MAITITRAEVKRKCMISSSDTTWDTDADALMAELQPSIEYTIADQYLNDTANTKLQAVLKLGILEMVSGELLQQIYRTAGASESVSVGGVSLGVRQEHGAKLIDQGVARLRPFQKLTDGLTDEAVIATNADNREREFSSASMEGW